MSVLIGDTETVLVRTTSHRAREKLTLMLGHKPQSYFTFWSDGCWQEIPQDRLPEALKIKGVVLMKRRPKGLMQCWETK